MKKQIIILLIIILGLDFTSCVKSDMPETKPTYTILVNNNTNKDLLVFYQLNYPDTTLQQNRPEVTKLLANTIGLLSSEKKWDEIISQNKDSIISFFFLASGTFEKHPWDSVRSKYIILKRMEFPLDSLQNLKWTVRYGN